MRTLIFTSSTLSWHVVTQRRRFHGPDIKSVSWSNQREQKNAFRRRSREGSKMHLSKGGRRLSSRITCEVPGLSVARHAASTSHS